MLTSGKCKSAFVCIVCTIEISIVRASTRPDNPSMHGELLRERLLVFPLGQLWTVRKRIEDVSTTFAIKRDERGYRITEKQKLPTSEKNVVVINLQVVRVLLASDIGPGRRPDRDLNPHISAHILAHRELASVLLIWIEGRVR